jgi:hypothetical protein
MPVNAVADGSQGGAPTARLRSVGREVLESLYQHRLLSTAQLHAMHTPHASRRWMQRVMVELAGQRLVAFARSRGALRVWHLTEAGAELVEGLPDRVEERRKLLDARHAAGPLQAHTLAVNEVGIAFLQAARERGDEFSPRSWQHEIAHPIGPPPGMRRGELLVADAVFSYLLGEKGAWRLEYRFVELDRGTLPSDRLAAKLARYARLYRFHPRGQQKGVGEVEPAWMARYPVFPALLVVFADRPRAALERRLDLIAALCRTEPDLKRTPQISIFLCLLDDLRERGPFAPIFIEPERPDEPVDWLSEDGSRAQGATEAAPEEPR